MVAIEARNPGEKADASREAEKTDGGRVFLFGVACFIAGALGHAGLGLLTQGSSDQVWAEVPCASGYHRDVELKRGGGGSVLCRNAAFPSDFYHMRHEWRLNGPGVSEIAPTDPALRPPR